MEPAAAEPPWRGTGERCRGVRRSSRLTYEGSRRKQSAEQRSAAGVRSSRQEFSYDDAGELASLTDGTEDETTYSTDALGRVTETADALGDTTEWVYTACGLLESTTDPL